MIVAFLPAAVIGLALNDWIEEQLGDNLIAIAQHCFSVQSLCLLQKKTKKYTNNQPQFELEYLDQLNFKQAFSQQLAQCLAYGTGMSRSMVTIIGGYWTRLNQKSCRIQLLIGLITLSAASAYKVLTDGAMLTQTLDIQPCS